MTTIVTFKLCYYFVKSNIFPSVFQRGRKTHDASEVKYQRLASETELWMNVWLHSQNT